MKAWYVTVRDLICIWWTTHIVYKNCIVLVEEKGHLRSLDVKLLKHGKHNNSRRINLTDKRHQCDKAFPLYPYKNSVPTRVSYHT